MSIYFNGKRIAGILVESKTPQNDINSVMSGGFYDLFTENFIDQIMTGKYIIKGDLNG
ncbi:MAG: hypothetical protein IKI95_07070 [Clostridia bacterium]|nr:hypothetical protein [Clostridia bacterium]